jgi:glutathione peroxidase
VEEGTGVHQFTLMDIDGKEQKLSQYKGKVLLVVNVASKCGLTPQYRELEATYGKYREKGLVVLGFPANEFGAQEPGTEKEIKEFCTTKYQVTFPMFSKIVVKGEKIHPLYAWLTGEETNPEFKGEIGWNFTKFLVGRDGQVIRRIGPKTKVTDEAEVKAIEEALAAK